MADIGESHPPRFEGAKKITGPDGWISDTGLFYPCTSKEYDELAKFLVQTQKSHIQSQLEQKENYRAIHEIESATPGLILKEAGYALLSDGQMREANLPEALTMKQLELLHAGNITFAPESGKISPSTYIAYKKLLDTNPDLSAFEEQLSYRQTSNEFNFHNFIENPTGMLALEEPSEDEIAKVFDMLTLGSTAPEITYSAALGKEKITFKQIAMPSGEDIYVQCFFHNHALWYDDVGFPEYEAWFTIMSQKEVDTFLEDHQSNITFVGSSAAK